MRPPLGVLALTCSLLLGVGGAAAAQQPGSPPTAADPSLAPLSQSEDRELAAWLAAMAKWQRYDAKWQNRPARDGLWRITARRPLPAAPAWLAARCAAADAANVLELEPRLTTACRLVADPRTPIESAPAVPVPAEQPPKHSSFLTRVHIDGLWSTTSTSGRIYGLIGSHVSLVDVGRLQVFGPPGVLVLSVPDNDGSRRITLGYTWGLSVRLTDMRLFGGKDMTLFVNLSKVWVASGADDRASARGYDIVGFSIAPRKNR
jgi:hypothetical protein